jgi:plastocyanin
MGFVGPAPERVAIAACLLASSMSTAGCSRPPLPAEGGADAAPQVPAFLAVPPCPDEASYATGTEVVTFGFLGTPPGFSYEPKCLAIDAGETVTFSGSFAAHPLYPSAKRGTLQGNPIGGTSSGDRKEIRFGNPGFFAYYCGVHGGSDDGSTMAGVIWAR